MMAVPLKQSTAVTVRLGPFLDKADGVTEEDALTPTVEVSKNHGAFAARNSATAIAHDAAGWYSVPLDTTDTGTLGPLLVKSDDAANHLPVWREFVVLPANVYDSLVAGTDNLDVSPSAAAIADAVLDELLADHQGAGSVGAAIDAVAVPAGLRQITISVVDGVAAPVADVNVAIYDSGNTAMVTRGDTDAGGQLVVNLDDATYKVRLMKGGYTFTTPQTLVVSADASAEYTATEYTPTPASSPDLCMVFGTLLDAGGNALEGATVRVRTDAPDAVSGNQLTTGTVEATTDATGYFELELVRNAEVVVSIQAAKYEASKTVPNLASQNLATWS
jgi:hypothetical protein